MAFQPSIRAFAGMFLSTKTISRTFGVSSARAAGTWAGVPQGPPDPILGVTEAFKRDKDPRKVNLGVGAYRDDNGNPFVLSCIRQAEETVVKQLLNKEYLPISGHEPFTTAASKLALGDNLADSLTLVRCQALSGTGALRIAAEFITRFYQGNKVVLLPNPTWGNHNAILKDVRLPFASYRYYNPKNCGLDLPGLLEDLKNAPSKSIVLLHACAHNPTGVDPTPDEWKQIAEVMKSKEHFAFFDVAYQGFASGDPSKDAYALRLFSQENVPLLFAQSFSKNFGLYGERLGNLTVVVDNKQQADAVDSQLKIIVRPMYSNPPTHGARLVSHVLADPKLKSLWEEEVKLMADRIIGMRTRLRDRLLANGSKINWDHITKQIGMFCYSGLTESQVDRLTNEFHIYLTRNGRISMAGVTSKNVDYLADAMHEVTK